MDAASPERIRELVERLEKRLGRPRRISRFDPMEELVSCILSQHTTDASSFPAFTRLRETFSSWDDIVRAGPGAVAPVIRNAGLANQKARSIVGCLVEIHRRTGDYSLEVLREMPTMEARGWLMSLPGVGPKTASIVLCFSFGRETIPVDTHIFRVAKRLGLVPEGQDERRAHDTLMDVVPPDLAFRFHVALIQHGRTVCRAPVPLCPECTIADLCEWYKATGGSARVRKKPAGMRPG
jgi:endonuclease-3